MLCPFYPHPVLRRVRPGQAPLAAAERVASGPFQLDRLARIVGLDDKPVDLSAKAISVLEYLMLRRDEVISRERLLDAVWGLDAPIITRAVDVRIAELRKMLNDERIAPRFMETVLNVGYRFIGPVDAVP